jgi:hypothetical protein
MLKVVTDIVHFVGLVSSLWLGFYVLSRNPRKLIPWLTALTMWSLSGLFLNVLLALNPIPTPTYAPEWLRMMLPFWRSEVLQGNPIAWLQGWSVTLAIAFWHHITTLMRPGPLTLNRKIRISVGYLIAGAAAFIQDNTQLMFAPPQGDPLYVSALHAGPYYLFFALALLVYLVMSMINLVRSYRETPLTFPRYQFRVLAGATILAGLTGPIAIIGTTLGVPIPMFVISLLLTIAVILIGHGISRYSALVEDRTLRRGFAYNAVSISLVTLVYLGAAVASAQLFQVTWSFFIVFIVLAIVTHSLVDTIRSLLDDLFYKDHIRDLRVKLRKFGQLSVEEESIHAVLSESLEALCDQVRASFGLLALFNEEKLKLAASYNWEGDLSKFNADAFQTDDFLSCEMGHFPGDLNKITLLIPLYNPTEQIGALLFGHPVNGVQYADGDIDFLLYPSDQLSETIRLHQLRSEKFEQVSELLTETPQPEAAEQSGEITIKQMENALRNLYDLSYLGDHPLASLRLTRSKLSADEVTHIDRGRAVYQVIEEGIEKLRPAEEAPPQNPPRDWYPYLILFDAYIEDVDNREIMSRLYISEGTFNRTRRAAVRAVTRVINEVEAAF